MALLFSIQIRLSLITIEYRGLTKSYAAGACFAVRFLPTGMSHRRYPQ